MVETVRAGRTSAVGPAHPALLRQRPCPSLCPPNGCSQGAGSWGTQKRLWVGGASCGPNQVLMRLPGPQLPRLSLMEPESEFRDIEEVVRQEAERRGSGLLPAGPEPTPRPAQHRGSLRSTRGSSLEDRGDQPAAPRPAFPASPREKPARRVSDSFFRPSVMEPILGRAQYSQLRKKS